MAAHMAFPSTSSGKGADGQGAFTDSEVVSGQEETGDDQYRRVLGEVLKASRATSTANKYSKAFSAWQEWCLVHRVSHMPASQDDISRYNSVKSAKKRACEEEEGSCQVKFQESSMTSLICF
ncbi:uncharacterized protein [Amphiura filiformis]|uniref:uncharacterized protein n=1 Tax=Amphiura filiformis TaxID=82378 RepID=UPI003B21BE6B